MRIVRALYVASAAAGLLLGVARQARAQDGRSVVLRLHKAGDTLTVRNAQVMIDHSIDAGTTDSAGIVRVHDLDDGGHIVEAVARGYQAFFDKFASGPGVAMPIQLELLPVEVTAKAKGQPTALQFAGFDGRRAGKRGKFFTLAQLKSANGRPLANVLTIDAGAFIAPGPRGESFLASGAQPRPPVACYSAVVRDGLRIYPFEGATPPDLDKIFTDDLAGVELYAQAALVPAEFRAELRDASACGALVLWSRDAGR